LRPANTILVPGMYLRAINRETGAATTPGTQDRDHRDRHKQAWTP
jgi:hypothetical protein